MEGHKNEQHQNERREIKSLKMIGAKMNGSKINVAKMTGASIKINCRKIKDAEITLRQIDSTPKSPAAKMSTLK